MNIAYSWVKALREGRDAVQDNLCTVRPHMENNTVQFLVSLFDADRRWTATWVSSGSCGVCHKSVLHILYDILDYHKLAACWITHEISKVQQLHCCAVTQALLDRYQRKVTTFLDKTLAHSYEPNLKCQSNEWKHQGSPLLKKVHPRQCAVKVLFLWHIWGNTAPCCTSKADDKFCILLHVPAAPPSSSTQEKTMTLGGTELHRSSWQCKE